MKLNKLINNRNNIKYFGIICFLVAFAAFNVNAETDTSTFFEELKKESLEFNPTVTDGEIIDYLEFKYVSDPDVLNDFRSSISDPVEREVFLSNYRRMHTEAYMKIPTLRGMSQEEIKSLRMIFDFKQTE